jgi:hypothetical protein
MRIGTNFQRKFQFLDFFPLIPDYLTSIDTPTFQKYTPTQKSNSLVSIMERAFQISYNRVRIVGRAQMAEPPSERWNAIGEHAGRGIGFWPGQIETASGWQATLASGSQRV